MNLELFAAQPRSNLLPYDGSVKDYGQILTETDATAYLQYFLQQLAWPHDEVILYGKHIRTSRMIAWYGDEKFEYHYSGMIRKGHIWDNRLWKLKQYIEKLTGQQFNSCLANLYQDGSQGMGWHSDDEKTLGQNPVIASVSLGATRKFCFRHKTQNDKIEVLLQHGQLLLMRDETQHFWKHALMKSTRVQEPRINLTFRYFWPEG